MAKSRLLKDGVPLTYEELCRIFPLRRLETPECYDKALRLWFELYTESPGYPNHEARKDWADYLNVLTLLLGQADAHFSESETLSVEYDEDGLLLNSSREEVRFEILFRLGISQKDIKRPFFWEFSRIRARIRNLTEELYAWYRLQFLKAKSVDEIPDKGRRLLVVAQLPNQLHFRFFGSDERIGCDISESDLPAEKNRKLQLLKAALQKLSTRRDDVNTSTRIRRSGRDQLVIRKIASVTGYQLEQKPIRPFVVSIFHGMLERDRYALGDMLIDILTDFEPEERLKELVSSYRAAIKAENFIFEGAPPSGGGTKYDKLVATACITQVKTGRLPSRAEIREFLIKELKLSDLDNIDETALSRSIRKLGLSHLVKS